MLLIEHGYGTPRISRSNPRPTFTYCTQNDITGVLFCPGGFGKKEMYTTLPEEINPGLYVCALNQFLVKKTSLNKIQYLNRFCEISYEDLESVGFVKKY